MKRVLVLAVLLSFCFPGFGQSKRMPTSSAAKIERELRDLVKTWNDAEIKQDIATIDKLLAPEFSFLGGSSRKEYLESVVPDKALKYFATIEEIKVDLYTNVAIVTTLDSVNGSKGEKAAEGKILIMTIWVRRGARWLCVKASIHVVDVQIHAASNKRSQRTGINVALIDNLRLVQLSPGR